LSHFEQSSGNDEYGVSLAASLNLDALQDLTLQSGTSLALSALWELAKMVPSEGLRASEAHDPRKLKYRGYDCDHLGDFSGPAADLNSLPSVVHRPSRLSSRTFVLERTKTGAVALREFFSVLLWVERVHHGPDAATNPR
jgi:hypothetical protein